MGIELCFSNAYHPQTDVVYGYNLSSVLYLTPIPHAGKFCGKAEDLADQIKDIHEKNRYFVGEYNKLSNRKIGPCEILTQINDNAYKLKLPSQKRTSDVFNIKHLIPYAEDTSSDEELNSRKSSLQPGKDDAVEIIVLNYLERSDLDRKKTKQKII
ncbi:hypothetical protein AMTRI_Chr11g157670 [Amborella trichopoda]